MSTPWIASAEEDSSIKGALEMSSGTGGWRLEKKGVLSISRRRVSFQKIHLISLLKESEK